MVNGLLAKGKEGLFLEMLPPSTRRAFLALSKSKWLAKGKENWYLAGGTDLALQAGHRISEDLDFFTTKKDFDIELTKKRLSELGAWKTTSESLGTLYGTLFGAKISFIAYRFFKPPSKKIKLFPNAG